MCLVTQLYPTLCNPMDCSLPGSSVHRDTPGKNTEVGCHALLQGIFPTQGLNPGLPYFRWILYWLSHQGNIICIALPQSFLVLQESIGRFPDILIWIISEKAITISLLREGYEKVTRPFVSQAANQGGLTDLKDTWKVSFHEAVR